jgi:hypothetical protein
VSEEERKDITEAQFAKMGGWNKAKRGSMLRKQRMDEGSWGKGAREGGMG